ncbi:hypothetical protein BU15DRAFT_75706 [Melanogaster broomeanus]|nr:hypothetical protein BU15DRAFT_75706 [Melanogaster broomeanus]
MAARLLIHEEKRGAYDDLLTSVTPHCTHRRSLFFPLSPFPAGSLSVTGHPQQYPTLQSPWFFPQANLAPESGRQSAPFGMCSTRGRIKSYLSLDTSRTTSSDEGSQDYRWSQIVPPKSALTFAALWDPEEGMVTFSGASLLECESLTGIASRPDVFDDDRLRVISADRDTDTLGENTATLATLQDAFKAFLHRVPRNSKQSRSTKCLQTRASSIFDGCDVYSRDIEFKPQRSLPSQRLCGVDRLDMESSFKTPSAFGRFRLRSDLRVNNYHSENESCVSRHAYLKSRFSTTTTSTSNYVEVAHGLQNNPRLVPSTLSQVPEQSNCSPPSSPCTPRRRLRKRRPCGGELPSPGSPFSSSSPESRGQFSYSSAASPPVSPTSPSKSPRYKFAVLQRRKPRGTSDEGWICIEVTPVITQRYVASLDDD